MGVGRTVGMGLYGPQQTCIFRGQRYLCWRARLARGLGETLSKCSLCMCGLDPRVAPELSACAVLAPGTSFA